MNYGDIIQLGQHKLMCGDATKLEDIQKLIGDTKIDLVLTDPPYGMKMEAGYYRFKKGYNNRERDKIRYSQPHYKHIKGDTNTTTAKEHYNIIKELVNKIIFWGGNYFTDFLPPSKCWLIWNKEQALPNHADAEMAWTNIKDHVRVYKQLWNGCCREGSIKLNPRPALHLTQKPVELHMKILEDFSKPGDVVLDCFGGSGTTLIACEMTGRQCLMMELSPEYCDIIADRYNSLAPIFTLNKL